MHDWNHFVSFDGCLILSEYSLALSCFILPFYLLHYITVTLTACFIKNPLLSGAKSSVFLNPKTLSEWTMVMDLQSILPLVLQVLLLFSRCVINFLSPINSDQYPIFFHENKGKITNLRMEWMENATVLRECELHKLLRSWRCKASRGYNCDC